MFAARLEEGHGAPDGANAAQAQPSAVPQVSSRHLFFIFAHPGFSPFRELSIPQMAVVEARGRCFHGDVAMPEVGEVAVVVFEYGPGLPRRARRVRVHPLLLWSRPIPRSMPERGLSPAAAGGVSRVPSRFHLYHFFLF